MSKQPVFIDVEKEIRKAGSWGRFQTLLIGLTVIPLVLTGSLMVVSLFETMSPTHQCDIPGLDGIQKECRVSMDTNEIRDLLVPQIDDEPSTCRRFDFKNQSEICELLKLNKSSSHWIMNETIKCTEWVYDTSVMRRTIVSEFNLVCGSAFAGYISQSTFMLGVLIGSVFSGAISDRFGRRKAYLFCGLGWLVFGTATAFAQSYASYTVLAAITGFFGYSQFPVSFILGSEFMVVKYRAVYQQFTELSFTFGIMLLSLVAFLTKDWRHLRISLSVPMLLVVPIWWFLPESPRWLLCKGKVKEAKKVLKRLHALNKGYYNKEQTDVSGVSSAESFNSSSSNETIETLVSHGFWKEINTIWSYPGLRFVTLIQFFEWFSVSSVYYGLTLNAAVLGGDPFSNLFYGTCFEVVGNVITIPLVNILGRTPTAGFTQILSGVFCISMSFAANDVRWIYVGVSIVGRTFISIAFSAMYIHASEIYPTPIRSVGTGICSAAARIGGIVSPLIAMLSLFDKNLPYIVFGILSVVAGLLSLNLPETNKEELQPTVEKGEEFINNHHGLLKMLYKKLWK